MLEIARYEARKRVRGSIVLSLGVAGLIGLYLWMWPRIAASGVDLDQYVDSFPPALRELFGIESLSTIEGFLAAELYAFVWVLLLGLYLAYAAASVVAGDVESGRMDVLLSLPVSRARLLGEKALSLVVPVTVPNLLTPPVVLGGVAAVGETLSAQDLLAVHALSVPYLLACAALGLLASVSFDRESVAQRVAAGVVFALFLVESVVTGTEFAWLGAVAPTRYYDPTAVLVDSTYDVGGALVLLLGTAVVALGAVLQFRRRDVN
jgi:ABC-2 type transport system permease protein